MGIGEWNLLVARSVASGVGGYSAEYNGNTQCKDVTLVDRVHLGGHCFLVARRHVF